MKKDKSQKVAKTDKVTKAEVKSSKVTPEVKATKKAKATDEVTKINTAEVKEKSKRDPIYKFQLAEEKVDAIKAKSLRSTARNTLKRKVGLILVYAKNKNPKLQEEIADYKKFVKDTYVSPKALYMGSDEELQRELEEVEKLTAK